MLDIDGAATTGGQQSGDLWRAHAPVLLQFASVLVGPTDAHDVVIEAFLRSTPALTSGRAENPRAYLMRSVANQAHNLRRGRERRWARDLVAVPLESSPPHESLVDVRRAVANLSLAQRAVVYFVYWEDLREQDIADVLGISPGSVRRHLVRARAHLRKALS